jgi:hypothetical protein
VAVGILPRDVANTLQRLEPWGPGLLMTLILLGWFTPINPIGWLIGLAYDDLFSFLV